MARLNNKGVALVFRAFLSVMRVIAAPVVALMFLGLSPALAAGIEPFVGVYSGSADVVSADGSSSPRDMSVEISQTRKGFEVKWSSATHKPDGRIKEKSYDIDFIPSDRDGIYSAAMKKNVFGHDVQLDPMKGEPYVWGRIAGDTLTVYSLFVAEDGGYEIQQFDRTLADGGLQLDFKSLRNGEKQRTVSTFLKRQ